MKPLSIIILTKNEEQHLPRLLESIRTLDAEIVLVDSFSTDRTLEIARDANARIYQNAFINHAAQFQWALENCAITTPWIMRMDADEYLTAELVDEIRNRLPDIANEISGIILKRQVHFMGKWIRHGGYYPIKLLRIWRTGQGVIEQKWMDEHIALTSGRSIEFQHDIVDANLNNLSWWTEKHNYYATREAVDLLNKKYHFFKEMEIKADAVAKEQTIRKRWYKQNLYLRMPLFLRAFLYFHFRYFILLGFLDGRRGLVWHFLQGFWYRFLVDAKIFQIEWMAGKEGISVRDVIEKRYHLKIDF